MAQQHIPGYSEEKLQRRHVQGRVVVIDDDPDVLAALAAVLEHSGYACETYQSALAYLHALSSNHSCLPGPVCILCDVKMPEIDGLALQRLIATRIDIPLLMMSGSSNAKDVVEAFRYGIVDFLIKPFDNDDLLAAVAKAINISAERQARQQANVELLRRMATLTKRESEVARRVAAGQISRVIAADLGIGLRTVKLYRQRMMEKLGVETVEEFLRIADVITR